VFLTFISDVVVFEIVAGKSLILDHTELNCFDHLGVIIELVISEVDLLEALGDRSSEEDFAYTLVS
jgi:hypothetical protein